MLTSRGQENVIHARPTAGKSLIPKTPSNFQTPRTSNRAPLGAKTTNVKAQTVLKDQKNAKPQVFQTPAPGQQKIRAERATNRASTTKRSGRPKITIAPSESIQIDTFVDDLEDDGPDIGYAPPPPVELPDPPMESGIDETYPQFRPENMFRGYGEMYYGSPKDDNGFSIRVKQEEAEYRQYLEAQEQALLKKIKEDFSKPLIISDDEFDLPSLKVTESFPNSAEARSAASALSGMKAPAVANKSTASSRLKMNKPIQVKRPLKSNDRAATSYSRPFSVSKNTIGFPKAKIARSIVPSHDDRPASAVYDADGLAEDFSDPEFSSLDDEADIFQLPIPE